jgi:outer membrane protein
MKNFIFFLCFLFATAFSAQKIAHLDFDSLVSRMPETKQVKEQCKQYMGTLNETMAKMDRELQEKYQDYMSMRDKMADDDKKKREQEISMLQQKVQFFRQQAEEDYQNKVTELTLPLIEKAKKAIESVARDKGYKYVFDLSGRILYSEPGEDILALTEKKLNAMTPAKAQTTNEQSGKKDASKDKETGR